MAFCSNCGAQIEDGAAFFLIFWTQVGANPNAGVNQDVDPVGGAQSSQATPDDVNQNKIYAVLAYFGILVLIPILAAPKSEFAKFHSNQGLVLFIGEIALSILGMILGSISFLLGSLVSLVSIGALVLAIIGIINAAKGEMKELPLIGSIKILK